MRSFAIFISLLAIPSAHAAGLRRLRRVEHEVVQPQKSENEIVKEQVSQLYLGLADEVQGQTLNRVLNQRRRKESGRKLIDFQEFQAVEGRERLYDALKEEEEAADEEETRSDTREEDTTDFLAIPVTLNTPEETAEVEDMSMPAADTMSMEMSMTFSAKNSPSSEVNSVISLSMSM